MSRFSNISEWSDAEWHSIRKKLEAFSFDELKTLATRCGIRFEGGIDSVENRPQITAKEQIISVLDEVPPQVLTEELHKISHT